MIEISLEKKIEIMRLIISNPKLFSQCIIKNSDGEIINKLIKLESVNDIASCLTFSYSILDNFPSDKVYALIVDDGVKIYFYFYKWGLDLNGHSWGRTIKLEEIFELISDDHKKFFIYHLDLFS